MSDKKKLTTNAGCPAVKAARFLIDAGGGWGNSFHVCLSKRKADAAIGPSTPVSSMLQKKADNTTPTIQAVVPIYRR